MKKDERINLLLEGCFTKKSTPKSTYKVCVSCGGLYHRKHLGQHVCHIANSSYKSKRYIYTSLIETCKGPKERVNFYCIILSSSGIYYQCAMQKYLRAFKLIDSTVNSTNTLTASMTLTMFANEKASLPSTMKVGAILRVHRGQIVKYGNGVQINCDVGIKGAWLLFQPKESISPIAHSGRTYSFYEEDKKTLKDIGAFSWNYFASHDICGQTQFTLRDAEITRREDFDCICYVITVSHNAARMKFLLCDCTKVVKLVHAPSFPELDCISPSDVIYIRSANYKSLSKNELVLNEYSGVLRVPIDYKSSKELLNKLKAKEAAKSVCEKFELYYHSKDRFVGQILAKTPKHPSSLHEIFLGCGKSGIHYVRVNALEIRPRNYDDWLQIDNESGLQYLKLELIVKDATCAADPSFYPLYLCTITGKGKEFISLPSDGKTIDEDYIRYRKMVRHVLCTPWVYIDCMIEKGNDTGVPVYFILNTKLNFNN